MEHILGCSLNYRALISADFPGTLLLSCPSNIGRHEDVELSLGTNPSAEFVNGKNKV